MKHHPWAGLVRLPMWVRFGLVAGWLGLGAGLWAPPAAAAGTPQWKLEIGAFGLRPEETATPFAAGEYRLPPWRWGVFPVVGGLVNGDGGLHLGAGLGRTFPLGGRFAATVSVTAGYYHAGGSKDLGLSFEFHDNLEVTYRLRPETAIGLTVAHLSNAGFGEHNPGVETVGLTVTWRPHGVAE